MTDDATAAAALPAPLARSGRLAVLACLGLALVMALPGLGAHSPWLPDEPRVAGIGAAMHGSGDWLVPRLNGEPFLEKPPLYWWVQASCFSLFGVSDASARLPSALFSVATLLICAALGWRLGGPRAAVLAAAALATCTQYFELTHRTLVDPALVFSVSLSQLGFLLWQQPRGPGGARRGTWMLALAVPLSFLAKGVIGPVLCVGPPLLWLLSTRRWSELRRALPLALACLGSTALLVGAWLVMLFRHAPDGPALVHEVLVNQTLGRVLGAAEVGSHPEPPLFYLRRPGLFAPWVLTLPALVAAAAKAPRAAPARVMLALFGFGLLLLSLPSGKRSLYVLPLLPALGAGVGWWLAGGGRAGRLDRPTRLVLLGLLALVACVATGGLLLLANRAADDLLPPLALLAADLTPGASLLVVSACALAAVFLARAFWRHLRAGSLPPAGLLLVPFAIVLLANLLLVQPRLDPLRSLRPLTAAVRRLIPGSGPIPVWRPSESLVGMLRFDLGRDVRGFRKPEALEHYLRSTPGAALVYSADRRAALPEPLASRLTPLFEDRPDHEQHWVLARWH